MSLFQRLAGDTSTFAFRLDFDRDPDEGKGAGLDEFASWGSFRIWVRGRNLCAHWEDGEEMGDVHWYLLPLLEWLVSNWNSLFHEGRLPLKTRSDDAWDSLRHAIERLELTEADESRLFEWKERHSLLACRDGGLFPDVVFRRLGSMVEVSWGECLLAGMPSHYRFFESHGHDVFEPDVVAHPVYDVVSDAVGYLRKRCPESQRILQLQQSLSALHSPANRPLRVALLAGLGETIQRMTESWTLIVDRIRSRLPDGGEALLRSPETDLVVTGSSDAALMFGSASPSLSNSDLLLLADALIDAFLPDGEPETVRRFVLDRPYENIFKPWSEGYSLAGELLEELSISAEEVDSIDVTNIAESLQIRLGELSLEDRELRAVALAGEHHRPTILLNHNHATNRYPSGIRFSTAHELCHVLFDRSYGNSLAIVSGPWAPMAVEKRANAFAAMLLMPMPLIMKHARSLTVPLASVEGVGRLAVALKVSYTSLLRHLGNMGILDEAIVDALLESAGQRDAD